MKIIVTEEVHDQLRGSIMVPSVSRLPILVDIGDRIYTHEGSNAVFVVKDGGKTQKEEK